MRRSWVRVPFPAPEQTALLSRSADMAVFLFSRTYVSGAPLVRHFKKVRLFHRYDGVSAFLCAAFFEKLLDVVYCVRVRLLYQVKIFVCCGEVSVTARTAVHSEAYHILPRELPRLSVADMI